MPVPSHVHTEYSNLDGLSTVEEVAARCAQIGCPCCGITDHGTVSGHLAFDKAMRAKGIKPIFGAELYHGVKTEFGKNERDASHLIVGALTSQGLLNLWAMVDDSASNFRYVSRVNWQMLEKYHEGMYATSACALGLVSKQILNGEYEALNRYLEIFRDDYYIELHTYPGDKVFEDGGDGPDVTQKAINLALVQVAQERGIPVIYADDAHYAFPEQYELHDAYMAMKMGQTIYTPIEERRMWHPKTLYIKDEAQIREDLHYLPESIVDEAIANSEALGERVSAELPNITRHLPIFVPKESQWVTPTIMEDLDLADINDLDAAALLIREVEFGIWNRYGDSPAPEVWDRASRELAVFIEAGLEHYFLIAWDLVQYCKANDIEIGPGRGSSAGCIVAYCLGITDVCPLHYDLIFERFWNAGRADGFPDIDMDFPRAERRNILHYLEERWGYDHVRTIGTITRMKPKSVVDATFKACAATGTEAKELKNILDNIPDLEIHGPDTIGWDPDLEPGKTIYVESHVGEEIRDWIKAQPIKRQEILENWMIFCKHLCSRISNYGMHPSGVLITDAASPVKTEAPSRWNRDEQLRITMFPMDEVDKRQLIKMDILGLRTLDTLTDWKNQMRAKGVEIEWSGMEMDEYPVEMWMLGDDRKTLGLFQIEDKPAVRKLVASFKPRSVEDLSIIVALNRPGPLRAAAGESESTAEKFVKRKNGEQDITYPHQFLEDILEVTYGLFLYQEQVIAFFNKMNYSLSDSDAIRKILGKKKPEAMEALKNGTGEWEGKGYMEMAPKYVGKEAERIWNTIVGFASYSFNKSHSVCYGTICWRTHFAKYYGSAEFGMACIRTDPKRAGAHVAETRRMGNDVLLPDILESDAEVSTDEEGNIRFGFADIKGIKGESAKYILTLREKYGEKISTRAGLEEALAEEKIVWKEEQKQAKLNQEIFNRKSPNTTLKSNQIDALEMTGAFDNYEERLVTLSQKQEMEQELLGVAVTDNSPQVYANNFEKLEDIDTYAEVNDPWSDEDVRYTVPGLIQGIRKTETRKDQKPMGIVTIGYEGDEAEFAVFPRQWKAYKFLFAERNIGIFTLKRTARGLHFDEGQKLS